MPAPSSLNREMPMEEAPTIDVHGHVLLPGVERLVAGQPGLAAHAELQARRFGRGDSAAARAAMIAIRPKLLDAAVRLADMDTAGVDVQLVSPSPVHYHYWAGPALATEVYQAANEAVAEHCAAAPGRLPGLGLAPIQDTGTAVAALEHALGAGLLGVEISSGSPGRELSDPALEPFWARAEELGAVIFLHPFGCTLDDRLTPWYLGNIVGQPVENAVALSHLIFSGTLDRHPGLRLIAAHGGGYLPTYLGRADRGWAVRPESHDCAEPPSSYLRRIWLDSLVHSGPGLRHLAEVAGPDRIVLGSDYPFDMGTDDPVGALRAAGLPDADFHAIRGGNARDLLQLDTTEARAAD
jgi:aminocarboxymuconate-semialdehyde decarboxylase